MPNIPSACRYLAIVFFLFMAAKLRADVELDENRAVQNGVTAAKGGDFLLAIRYFNEARAIAPNDPSIFFDLGRAELNIPGRELRAICWFEAYAAANGGAPDAGSVRSGIEKIHVKSQISLSRLIVLAKRVAASIPSDDEFASGRSARDEARSAIAATQANAGDNEGAMETINLVQNIRSRAWALDSIVDAMIRTGDVAGALKAADMIDKETSNYYEHAHLDVAKAQTKSGNVADALSTADQIDDNPHKQEAWRYISEIQARNGDIAGAEKTADLIAADGTDEVFWLDAQVAIVAAQADAGDIPGASKTADLIDLDTGYSRHSKSLALVFIATAQAKAGDLPGALATAATAPDDNTSKPTDEDYTAMAQKPAAKPQEKIDKPAPEARWLEVLDGELNAPVFMNLAEQLETEHSDDPQKASDGLMDVIRKEVEAQNIVERMLKGEH